jgi:hypothetical protein
MKCVFLTFDLEEFDLPRSFGKNIEKNEMFEISYKGLEKIIDILDGFKINATFFTTAVFCETYPDALKALAEKNHEIALHGYKHCDNYQKISEKNTCFLLKKAKEILEDTTKQQVIGYRSPRMENIDGKILKKVGIKYDSSLNPMFNPGFYTKYNNFNKPRNIFEKDGIIEVPISVTPVIRLPFSFAFFRIFGLAYVKFCTKLTFIDSDFVNLYFHPWEFADIKKYGLPFYFWKRTGDEMSKLLRKYIKWCLSNDLGIITIKEFIKNRMKSNF